MISKDRFVTTERHRLLHVQEASGVGRKTVYIVRVPLAHGHKLTT